MEWFFVDIMRYYDTLWKEKSHQSLLWHIWYLSNSYGTWLAKIHMLRKFLGAIQIVASLQNSQITFQIIFYKLMHIFPLPFFMQQTLQASFLLSATCKSFNQVRYPSSLCKLSNHSMVHSKIIKVSDDENSQWEYICKTRSSIRCSLA